MCEAGTRQGPYLSAIGSRSGHGDSAERLGTNVVSPTFDLHSAIHAGSADAVQSDPEHSVQRAHDLRCDPESEALVAGELRAVDIWGPLAWR